MQMESINLNVARKSKKKKVVVEKDIFQQNAVKSKRNAN